MKVILDKKYSESLRRLQRLGGLNGLKARKASTIVGNITTGVEAGAATTNNGETRIRNCVKYDLGDGYRLVTAQANQLCFLLFVGNHDQVDHYLNTHRGLEVVKKRANNSITLVATQPPTQADGLSNPVVTQTNTPYLQRLPNVDWRELISQNGLLNQFLSFNEDTSEDEIWASIADLQQLDVIKAGIVTNALAHLRKDDLQEAETVIALWNGNAEVVELEEEAVGPILDDPSNSERFVVLNDLSPAEIDKLFDPTRFQEWMHFLHPGQKRVVDENFDTPAVLTGVSGSGKTCVLIHRARRLVREDTNASCLVITLNRSLASLIGNLVKQVCSEEEIVRITVLSFHDYLNQMLHAFDSTLTLKKLGAWLGLEREVLSYVQETPVHEFGNLFRALDERVLLQQFIECKNSLEGGPKIALDRLEVFLHHQNPNLDIDVYLYEELELVRSAVPCYDNNYEPYLGYERVGRSIAFQIERRVAVLQILKAWEGYQIEHGFLDHMELGQAALLSVDEVGAVPESHRFDHVLVDEFQDFSTLDLQLIRRIPLSSKNGLFLTGDFAQKLYAKDLNFNNAGIGTGNRVLRSIRKNYRNAKQILVAADRLLRAFPPVGLNEDGLTVLDPETAQRETAPPIAFRTADPVKRAWDEARTWISEGHVAFSVCIATANPEVYSVESIVARCPGGIEAKELSGDYLLKPSTVVVSDMASIKGFEFTLVLLVGLDEDQFPSLGRPETERWRDALRLYVAITRGRDEVRFFYRQNPSLFLKAMGETIDWVENEEPIVDYQPEPEQDTQEGIEFLNGVPVVRLLPQPTSLRLAEILGKDQIQVDLFLREKGAFLKPLDPLQDHLVSWVCEKYRLPVYFVNQQSRAPEEEPKVQNALEIEYMEMGGFRLSLHVRTFQMSISDFNGTEQDATVCEYRLEGPNGIDLSLWDAKLNNMERHIFCGSRHSSPERWDNLVRRLRIGVRRLPNCEWMMALKQNRVMRNGWCNRYGTSQQQLDQGSGLDSFAILRNAGASKVGTRQEVYGETRVNRNQLCVTFPDQAQFAGVVSYVLTTVLPFHKKLPTSGVLANY
jgi:superfamily I DNA/RNA helicase